MARSVQTWAYNASMEHAMRRKSVQTLVTAVAEFTGDRCIMPKTKAICDMYSKLGGHNAYDIYENLGDEYVYEKVRKHWEIYGPGFLWHMGEICSKTLGNLWPWILMAHGVCVHVRYRYEVSVKSTKPRTPAILGPRGA